MNKEDTAKILIKLIREADYGSNPKHGYDVYLPSLVNIYLSSKSHPDPLQIEQETRKQLPHFYDAAWELCRRGIIRPGVNAYQAHATNDGSAGNGYSITPFGKKWLNEPGDDFVPTEPGRFSEMLSIYKEKFGVGFHQRAQQAVNCYQAHAYLACCVMCGAAVESILLATAIKKTNHEQKILNDYRGANGRSKIENMLIGRAKKNLREDFYGCNSLLKYWRNEAAHGQESKINENEAFIALATLLRFAKLVDENESTLLQNN